MSHIPQPALDALATRFNVSPGAAASGVGTSAAALVASLANHSSDTGLMEQLHKHSQDVLHSGVLNDLTSLGSGHSVPSGVHTGAGFIASLLGPQQNAVENAVAREAGLPAAAGASLMAVAGPATLAYLAQESASRGLSAASLGSWLAGEAASLKALLPAGLAGLLAGGTAVVAGATHLGSKVTPAAVTNVKDASVAKGFPWLFPLLGLLALALLAFFLMRGCSHTEPTAAPAAVAAPAALAYPELGAFIDRKLADGTVLHIPTNGIENHLIDFIESNKAIDKTTWFDFDRLTFDTGKATLQPASQEQLKNVEAILKAYPKVHAKIGGYTDNTGGTAANLTLSNDRATNVMHEIFGGGIDAARLEAKGYGEEHPVADNATAEGRQKNRRISLLVTAK